MYVYSCVCVSVCMGKISKLSSLKGPKTNDIPMSLNTPNSHLK